MITAILISLLSAGITMTDSLYQLPQVSITALKEQLPTDRLASSISEISFQSMQSDNIYRSGSLSSVVPGLHIPDYGASLTSTIYIRGLGSRMENPIMGLYVDAIPVLDKNSYDFDWEGIRGATVLRGPQGTLYGRNSMGGVLSLRTVSPVDDTPPTFKLEYGTFNSLRAGFSMVTGESALSITYRHTDGCFDNIYKGEMCDLYNGLAFRWKWERHHDERSILSNLIMANLSSEGGFAYGLYKDGIQYPVCYNDEGSYSRISLIDGLQYHYYGTSVITDAIVSFQMLADDMHMDQDYTEHSIFTLRQRQLSGAGTLELRVHKTDETQRWQPQTGLFALYRGNNLSAPVVFMREGIESLILDNANSHIPADIGQLSISDVRMPVNSDFMIYNWNAAIFHESVFKEGRWLLTAGIRLDYEGARMDYDCMTTLHYRFIPTMTSDKELSVPYSGSALHSRFELMPKFSALYSISDNVSVYSTLSRGYRAGGFNTQIFSDILQNMTMNAVMQDLGVYMDSPYVSVSARNTEYDPESAWNMELGVRFRKGSFNMEATGYHIRVSGQQLTVFPQGMSTGRMMTNAGRSCSSGIETQLDWHPGRFRTRLSWSWCDARFLSYNDGNNDYSGNRLPYIPEHTLYIGSGYSLRMNSKTLDIDASLKGAGPFSWDEQEKLQEPFRLRVDTRVALVSDKWEIYLRAENMTDEKGRSFYFKSVGNEFFASVKPRTVMTGITIKL